MAAAAAAAAAADADADAAAAAATAAAAASAHSAAPLLIWALATAAVGSWQHRHSGQRYSKGSAM